MKKKALNTFSEAFFARLSLYRLSGRSGSSHGVHLKEWQRQEISELEGGEQRKIGQAREEGNDNTALTHNSLFFAVRAHIYPHIKKIQGKARLT